MAGVATISRCCKGLEEKTEHYGNALQLRNYVVSVNTCRAQSGAGMYE